MTWEQTLIHFRIASHSYGDATLCGAEYTEPSAKAVKDGRLCDACIKVMWQEQYRRNTLRGVRIEDTQEEEQGHLRDDSHLSPLYLSSYEREA